MFWIFNIFFLVIYAFSYFRFRDGLYCAFQISRKKKRKGFKNYWWFESLREIKHLGRFYVINKIFVCLYALAVIVTVPLSFFASFRAVVIAFNVIIGAALIPMTLFGVIKSNKKEFGKSFVWLKIRTDGTKKLYSSVLDICWSLSPIFFIILECVV